MQVFYITLIVGWTFLPGIAIAQATEPIRGFTLEGVVQQRELEARFDALLQRQNLRLWMKQLSARPHHVGSAYGRQNAEFIASQFRSWGFETRMEEFKVLFPTPKTRVLEMIEPEMFKAQLQEPPLPEDSTSGQQAEQLPTYNAYSVDGDVTGELVYVNYGVPEDYERLKERGVDVKGKIVIARYGGSWRGIKPKVAAEQGAVGCIIYSDPRDDGYFRGDVYPRGAYRNAQGAQRGSVVDMPLFPGDPLTPGVGATENASRLPLEEAPTLTRIPVLPISHQDAFPLLQNLGGAVAPEHWRGALPLTYHLGPGPARVHLKVESNWDLTPAYNVIAILQGSERPDQWIIRGNHHDAWVNGASDPISGMVAVMEEARAIGELARKGWRPKRTIVYAAWDAEEPGLLGSVEWAETHADILRDKAAVYINSDGNSRGFLRAGGSHTLERFVNQIARDVIDPQKGISVAERLRSFRLVRGMGQEPKEARDRTDLRIQALGSGSDYTPFLQHLGIASLNLSYGGEGQGGSYHSIYDSFDHYTRFGDPEFQYGVALVQTAGRAVLRLAQADRLPFEFTNFADTISRYVQEVESLTEEMRRDTEFTNDLIREKRFEAVADPTQTYIAPTVEIEVPYINFAPLKNAYAHLKTVSQRFEQAWEELESSGRRISLQNAKSLDVLLFKSERALTSQSGLPGRPWFTHFVYAPGFYTGYGVKTLPAVREAIEQRAWGEVNSMIEKTASVLRYFADQISQAREILQLGGKGHN